MKYRISWEHWKMKEQEQQQYTGPITQVMAT